MSKKLGEILIERGLIDRDQLETALRNQLMLGGQLGTCLLELGYVNEESLGRTLADAHGVPYAGPDIFERVRPPIVKLLTRRVVEEYRAVPLEKSGKQCFVAMVNPRDIASIDALSFATGLHAVPWVAPETRIYEAMEKLYGIPRRPRYTALSVAMAAQEAVKSRPVKSKAKVKAKEPTAAAVAPAHGTAHGAEFGYGRSWVEIAKTLAPTDPMFHGSSDDAANVDGGDRLTERLCAANNRDDVGKAVVDETAATLARVALFSVKGEQLAIWTARGFDPAAARHKPFTIDPRGIFQHVLGDDHYRGPLGNDAEHLRFYSWLGIGLPAEILLVPVHLNDRLVALIYGDGGIGGSIKGLTESYVRLARMIAVALTIVVYKNKLRGIGSFTASRPAQGRQSGGAKG